MNLLLDPLPEFVKIDGSDYDLDTDFSTSIRFELLMMSDDVPNDEKNCLGVKFILSSYP